jgi:ankyrin repeat protein
MPRIKSVIFLTLCLLFQFSCTALKKGASNVELSEKKLQLYSQVENAVKTDDAALLEKYLGKDADINYSDKNGETLLMKAAYHNSLNCAELLLGSGADANAIAMVESIDMLSLFIAFGADVNFVGSGGTPLLVKFIREKPQEYSFELIKNGAEINVADKNGQTPLIWAVLAEKEELVELLLENGADADYRDSKGNTALYYSLSEETALKILGKNPNLQVLNLDGENIAGEKLLMAARISSKPLVRELVKAGVDINYRSYGETALAIANRKKDEEMIGLLQDLGAYEYPFQ